MTSLATPLLSTYDIIGIAIFVVIFLYYLIFCKDEDERIVDALRERHERDRAEVEDLLEENRRISVELEILEEHLKMIRRASENDNRKSKKK